MPRSSLTEASFRRPAASGFPRQPSGESGQALVEFTLILIPFLLLLFAMVDLARGVYTYNAVSQAAREMARSMTSQDACCDTGSSAEAQQMRNTQMQQVPGLADSGISIACVDINDSPASPCQPGDYARVRVTVEFSPLTPLLSLAGPFQLTSVVRQQYT